MPLFRDLFSRFSLVGPKSGASSDVPQQIYGGLVAQSRNPAFYMRYGIADTVMGRFDMLCLHVFLLSNRLAEEADPAARELGQEVFDCFVDDIDRALREIGIGDTSVPKRKKKLVRGFYGQVDDFAAPIAAGDAAGLAKAAARRFFGSETSPAADILANYMLRAHRRLKSIPFATIAAAGAGWPDPDDIVDV